MWSERWHTWNLWTLLWTAQSGRMRHFRSPAPCRDSQCFLWSQTWAARPISAPEVGAFHFVRQCTRTPPTPHPPVTQWVSVEWVNEDKPSQLLCSFPSITWVAGRRQLIAHSLLQIKTQSPNRSTGREVGSYRIYEKMKSDWMWSLN